MKVIASSGHYGVFWHSAPNSQGGTEHVVVYGLQVDRCSSFDTARQAFESAMYHAALAAGDVSEADYE